MIFFGPAPAPIGGDFRGVRYGTGTVLSMCNGRPLHHAPTKSQRERMSLHFPPACAQNTYNLLAELQKEKDLEALREHLIKFDLFPRRKDPQTAPIRYEELKELVKHLKLHRHRGFWRDHPEKDDLVRALHNHFNENTAVRKFRKEAFYQWLRACGCSANANFTAHPRSCLIFDQDAEKPADHSAIELARASFAGAKFQVFQRLYCSGFWSCLKL